MDPHNPDDVGFSLSSSEDNVLAQAAEDLSRASARFEDDGLVDLAGGGDGSTGCDEPGVDDDRPDRDEMPLEVIVREEDDEEVIVVGEGPSSPKVKTPRRRRSQSLPATLKPAETTARDLVAKIAAARGLESPEKVLSLLWSMQRDDVDGSPEALIRDLQTLLHQSSESH